jgi:hypothetical protein
MMAGMWLRRLGIFCWIAGLLVSAAPLRADDYDIPYDARTQGYAGPPTQLEDSGTVGAWFLWVIFSAIALGVMFKSGNRSHLD